jgi:UDP-N-acetyl-D-mannosaminuronic acid dehydrogenase
VDAWNAIAIANRHPRVDILQPGPGVGGHTINVDSWFLVQSAPDLTPLMRMARQVNDSQPQFVVDLIYHVLKNPQSLAGKRISLLGLAYKPDVDDLRGSPAVEIAQRLVRANAQVTAFEPFKLDAEIPGVRVAPRLEMALENAELVVLLVGHSLLRSLEPARLAASTPARLVVDTVNAWHEETWKAFGFQIFRLGATTAKHLA